MSKILIEDIRKEIEPDGWKLITDTYKNLDEIMTWECDEGHRVYAPWKKIRTKRECTICKENHFKDIEEKVIPKKKNVKRVFGIDQATYTTGYSIFDGDDLIKFGTFNTSLEKEEERLLVIRQWLISMISLWQPDYICFEGIQFQTSKNGEEMRTGMGVTTFEKLARLQGVIILTCQEFKIPFEIVHVSTWRKESGVKGKSSIDRKRSMQLLVKEKYDVTVTNDESDAIGIGIYASKKYKKTYEIKNWD